MEETTGELDSGTEEKSTKGEEIKGKEGVRGWRKATDNPITEEETRD